MSAVRLKIVCICFACAWLAGCSREPGPVEQVATSNQPDARVEQLPDQSEPAVAQDSYNDDSSPSQKSAALTTIVLPESRVRFDAPSDWKKVQPSNNIVEAEFELPRAEGDEYDGRLTLMSVAGDPQQTIATRKGEFNFEPGEPPREEKMEIAGAEATLVDLRGEWLGMASGQKMAPRPGYRMLLVIVPIPGGPLYVKLTGPRATLAGREDEFRAFLRSARLVR